MADLAAAEHPEHGRSAIVSLGQGAPSEIDLVLTGSGRIEGEVRRGGEPASGISVSASPSGLNQQNNLVTVTDAAGKFVLARVPPGHYSLSALSGTSPLDGVRQIGTSADVREVPVRN